MLALKSRSLRRQLVLGALVALALAYTTMFSAVTAPNERSRIYLAVAFVDAGTIEITPALDRFGSILDVAEREGRFYSDKAPGSSLLVAVLYAALTLFTQAEDWTIEQLLLLTRRGLMVPLGVAGFFALRRLMQRIGIGCTLADIVALGWILGSSAFHYSTAFYGHQIVGVALIVSLLLSIEAEQRVGASPRQVAILAAGAGAAAGMAGLTEYQAGIPALLLAMYVVSGPLARSVYGAAAFAAGALPFLLALGLYNTIAFGGPFELSYHHLSNQSLGWLHSQGVGGVRIPNRESFAASMLSLHQGLLTTSPMFVFVLPGAWAMFDRGYARLGLLLGAITGFYLLFVSSFNVGFTGWSFGPRLLVPGLGLFALLVAAGAQRLSRYALVEVILRGSVITGVVYHQLVHAVFPEPPPEAKNPLLDLVSVLFRADLVAPNLLSARGIASGIQSLVLQFAVVAIVLVFVLSAQLRARRRGTSVLIGLGSACVLALLFVVSSIVGPSRTGGDEAALAEFVAGLLAREPGSGRGP